MSYRIAVVEDDTVQLARVSALIREGMKERGADCTVSAFVHPLQMQDRFYDAFFLDISMPVMDGLAFTKLLRDCGYQCSIVFLSAMETSVFEALKVSPLRFVRKSRLEEDLPEALDALVQDLKQAADNRITLPVSGGKVSLSVRDILYIRSDDKVQQVVTAGQTYEVHSTVQQIEQQLKGRGFLRIHRFYLVNMGAVRRVQGNDLVMDNGKVLPVSRIRSAQVRAALRDVMFS